VTMAADLAIALAGFITGVAIAAVVVWVRRDQIRERMLRKRG
jgi:hypothetical protein